MADVDLQSAAVRNRTLAGTDLIFGAIPATNDAAAAFKADLVSEVVAFFYRNPVSSLTLAQQATLRTLLGLGSAALAATGVVSGSVPVLGAGGVLAAARLPGRVVHKENSSQAYANGEIIVGVSGSVTDGDLIVFDAPSNLGSDTSQLLYLTVNGDRHQLVDREENAINETHFEADAWYVAVRDSARWAILTDLTDALSQSEIQALIDTAINGLVDSAPGTLDTLNELAAALGDDPNYATTITNALALKAPLASPALTGTPTAPTAATGTNTTQIASTAFVAAALLAVAAGAQFRYGAGAPDDSLGSNGDSYLNTTTGGFSLKGSGTWTLQYTDQVGTPGSGVTQNQLTGQLAAYALLAGAVFTGAVSGIDPTEDAHLTTMSWVLAATVAAAMGLATGGAPDTLTETDVGRVYNNEGTLVVARRYLQAGHSLAVTWTAWTDGQDVSAYWTGQQGVTFRGVHDRASQISSPANQDVYVTPNGTWWRRIANNLQTGWFTFSDPNGWIGEFTDEDHADSQVTGNNQIAEWGRSVSISSAYMAPADDEVTYGFEPARTSGGSFADLSDTPAELGAAGTSPTVNDDGDALVFRELLLRNFTNLSGLSNTEQSHARAELGVTAAIDFLTNDVNSKAPLASPALTGTPTSPTAATGTNTMQLATTAFVAAAVAALVDSSPGALDTLNELAAALGDDPNFATTITNMLAGKLATDLSNVDTVADAAAFRSAIGAAGLIFNASTTLRGIIEIATDAESDGTGATRAVPPSGLRAVVGMPVTESERDAGTSADIKRFSPFDVADMIGTHAPAGSGGSVLSGRGEPPQATTARVGQRFLDLTSQVLYGCFNDPHRTSESTGDFTDINRSDITVTAEEVQTVTVVANSWLYHWPSNHFYAATDVGGGQMEWVQDVADDALAASLVTATDEVQWVGRHLDNAEALTQITALADDTEYFYYREQDASIVRLDNSSFTAAGGVVDHPYWAPVRADEREERVFDARPGLPDLADDGSDDERIGVTNDGLYLVDVQPVPATDPTADSWADYAATGYQGAFASDPMIDTGEWYANYTRRTFRQFEIVGGTSLGWIPHDAPTGFIGWYTSRQDALDHAVERGVASGGTFVAFTGDTGKVETATNFTPAANSYTRRNWVFVPAGRSALSGGGGLSGASVGPSIGTYVRSGSFTQNILQASGVPTPAAADGDALLIRYLGTDGITDFTIIDLDQILAVPNASAQSSSVDADDPNRNVVRTGWGQNDWIYVGITNTATGGNLTIAFNSSTGLYDSGTFDFRVVTFGTVSPAAEQSDNSITGIGNEFVVTDIDTPGGTWGFTNPGVVDTKRAGGWDRFLLADLAALTEVAAGDTPSVSNSLMFPLDRDNEYYLGRAAGAKIAVAASTEAFLPDDLRIRNT